MINANHIDSNTAKKEWRWPIIVIERAMKRMKSSMRRKESTLNMSRRWEATQREESYRLISLLRLKFLKKIFIKLHHFSARELLFILLWRDILARIKIIQKKLVLLVMVVLDNWESKLLRKFTTVKFMLLHRPEKILRNSRN